MSVDKLGNEDVLKLGDDERKQNLIDIMNEDAKDGLYDVREDDVEQLLEIVKGSKIDINEIAVPNETIDKYRLFLAGYNYAKENTYTEEHIVDAMSKAVVFYIEHSFFPTKAMNEIIQSLKQPKQ